MNENDLPISDEVNAEDTRDVIKRVINSVHGIADDLEKNGHPLPKENSKNFYLKACWVLRWLNKFELYKHDERVQNFRTLLLEILHLIKEVSEERKNDL
jgi:hypothetical protein